MKLRKQLLRAFLTIALLPLIVVGVYIFAANISLAFQLHEQNLFNSTEIQTDLLEDNINRLMVRARQFTSSRAVQLACQDEIIMGSEEAGELSNDILSFTDETLDNVAIFALMDQNGDFIYSSGSNHDSLELGKVLPQSKIKEGQYVAETLFFDQGNSLIIYTPVQKNGNIIGSFLIVCQTDYMLKIISSHRQMESSNTFIYCGSHNSIVTSKQDISGALPKLDQQIGEAETGSLVCNVNGRLTLIHYSAIAKTPWVLASTISIAQIFSQVWNYGLVTVLVFIVVFIVILISSRRHSQHILHPMDQLLYAVEKFFLGGVARFPDTDIDPKSEIGYLAEKFVELSDEITLSHGKLTESNYLYSALMKVTYEFRIVIDFQGETVVCSSDALTKQINASHGDSPSEKLLAYLSKRGSAIELESTLYIIAYGKLYEPMETVVNISQNDLGKDIWYRVVAVPVILDLKVCRVVLHFENITDQKRKEMSLIQSAQTDSLCGLLNKTAFRQQCRLSDAGKTDALFFIDLDKFKKVNDTFGHAAGDTILKSTAHAISAQFREFDVVGRFGGDEFVVFTKNISMTVVERKAKRLLQAISFYLDTQQGAEIHVTASVGVCLVKQPFELDHAIQLADEAMYYAKEKGPSQYHIIRTESRNEDVLQ